MPPLFSTLLEFYFYRFYQIKYDNKYNTFMRHICVYSTSRIRSITRVLVRDILCMARCPVLLPPTRDDADPFGGFILSARDPSTNG